MDKLVELYQLAKDENIEIIKTRLGKSNGLYFDIDDNYIIYLKDNLDWKCEKCILAEELGHHFSDVTSIPFCNNSCFDKFIRSRDEFNALKWASSNLIPPSVFKRCIGQATFLYEVAEELSVTEEFLERVYELYKQKGELA